MNKLMKIIVISLLIGFTFNIPISAQQTRQEKQEQKALLKQQKEIKRDLHKVSKQIKKKGITDCFNCFKEISGTPPVNEQMLKLAILEGKNTPEGYPEYIIINNQVIANSLTAATMLAQHIFKVRFEREILNYILSMVEMSTTKPIGNFDEQDTLVLRICENLVHSESQNIQKEIFPVLELYRVRTNDTVEVKMAAACHISIVREICHKVIEEIDKEYFSRQDGVLEKKLGLDKLIKSDPPPQHEETEE